MPSKTVIIGCENVCLNIIANFSILISMMKTVIMKWYVSVLSYTLVFIIYYDLAIILAVFNPKLCDFL